MTLRDVAGDVNVQIHVAVPDAEYDLPSDIVQSLVTGGEVYRRVKLGKAH